MDVGVVFQTDPPARAVVAATVRAEQAGFSHAWTFDSHVLWQEPYVVQATMLEATERIVVGPMVTNPATRDATVTASTFATLAEMHGPRVVCGIGRGDSAVRTLSGQPVTLAGLRESVRTIRTLTGGGAVTRGRGEDGTGGTSVSFPWVPEGTPPVEVWVAAYGPRALQLTGEVADGFILQLADPTIAAWTIERVRTAAEAAGRDPASIRFCVAAPAYVTDGSSAQLAHAREQTRWFGGMVGNHVADIVAKYGGDGAGVPRALSDYVAARRGYDYAQHGRAGNTHAAFVPDDVVDRFCVLGPPAAQLERLAELAALGCDQFALYAQHDAADAVVDAYGSHVVEAAGAL